MTALENTARILRCNKDELQQSILTKKITTKNESYSIPVSRGRGAREGGGGRGEREGGEGGLGHIDPHFIIPSFQS